MFIKNHHCVVIHNKNTFNRKMSKLTPLRYRAENLLQNKDKLVQKLNAIELPEKYKGTLIEKWAKYWKMVMVDYKEVTLDSFRRVKENPKKSLFYSTIFGTVYICGKKNPDLVDFSQQLRNCNNEIMLVHESCHSEKTSDYLIYLERCVNEGIIRRISFGVASFLWLANYNESIALYKAMCPHLKPKYTSYHERIIDVGFWNKWWNLSEKMVDYDIAENL